MLRSNAYDPRRIAIVVAPLFLAGLLTAAPGAARVVELEITRRVPILEPDAFRDDLGKPIPYELIEGRVHYAFAPDAPGNARVADLAAAARSPEHGEVRASGDFTVLQAIDPAQRSGTALFDVPNRGRRLALALMNRIERAFGASATLDPSSPADWGDGFLMRRGLTVVWVGWQADAPRFPDAMTLDVPSALTDATGQPIRGLARSDWVVDEDATTLPLAALGHLPNIASEPEAPENRLTRRRGRNAERELVPRTAWRFDEAGESILANDGPFEAGWIYELVYVSSRPRLLGLGFAAFRDFARYVKGDPDCPFRAETLVAHGLSQSGRYLRHFLYDGFNEGAAGEGTGTGRVFDGMMIQIGGAGRGGFNHRFGHPGRVGNPYANFFYPGDAFPFTGRPTRDGDREAGLYDRAIASGTLPKIFQINTGYEYWGRAASLIHMTPDGTRDVAPVADERLYHVASAPHYSLPFPPDPRSEVAPGLFVGSSVDTRAFQRALLTHLLAWVEADVAPPASSIPTIESGTLVLPGSLDYPVASLVPPRSPHVADRLDFGPRFEERIIDVQPPKRGAAYAIRVPGIDALGNEATGLRAVELQAPIGTYTPWALRHGKPGGADEMVGYIGSFLPLARSEAERAPGDTRPALRALYSDRDAYETRVAAAIDQLFAAGWLLAEDVKPTFDSAIARWKWANRPDAPATR